MTKTSSKQNLPHNAADECAVLAQIIFNPERLTEVVSQFGEEDFYLNSTRQVFRAMASVDLKNQASDWNTIYNEAMNQCASLDEAVQVTFDTAQKITKGQTIIEAGSAEWKQLRERIARNTTTRTLIRQYEFTASRLSLGDLSAEDAAEQIEMLHDSCRARKVKAETSGLLADRKEEMRQFYLDLYEGRISSLSTGWESLDEQLGDGGLPEDELTILAARPAFGKSALALNMAKNICKNTGGKVLFISLEMGFKRIFKRTHVSEAKVYANSIRPNKTKPGGGVDYGSFSNIELHKLMKTIDVLCELKLIIRDDLFAVTDIYREVKKQVRAGGLKAVFIDYLQLVQPDKSRKHGNREQEVASISRAFKLIAAEFKVPVIALSQLRRCDNEEDPSLSDLRESGSLEQDSGLVIFIAGDKPEERRPDRAVMLKIAKQRDGKLASVPFLFHAPTQSFIPETYEEREEAERAEREGREAELRARKEEAKLVRKRDEAANAAIAGSNR